MDTIKVIAFFVYCFFPSVAFSSVYNFTEPGSGALRSTPQGNTAHASSGKVSLESGRIRSTPQFTFNTAEGKKVGFTASRLATISTSRVGAALVTAARNTTPLGLGVTAAALLCTETEICESAGDWLFGEDFTVSPTPVGSCDDIGTGEIIHWTNGFNRTFAYTKADHSSCGSAPAGFNQFASCGGTTPSCQSGEALYQKDLGIGFAGEPARTPTDADWDNAALNPALNNDSVVPDLVAGNHPVPVGAPDPMAPQNFISGSETTTLRDDQGNITGSQVTERRVDITDVSDSSNPNSFDITEKKTVTNYDVNNNVVNSETTVINIEQPTEEANTYEIVFDEVPDETLQTKEIDAPLTTTSWGSGACPGNIDMSTSLAPGLEFNVQPFCDYAVAIRPFILIVASVFGGLIILGARKK